MKKLKRSTGRTQLLSKLRCSLLYSLSTFCCTCFRACCKGHSKVKYESFAQKLKILMFEYQKTGMCLWLRTPEGAENTTTFKEDLIQQTWRNGTGAQNLLHLSELVRKTNMYVLYEWPYTINSPMALNPRGFKMLKSFQLDVLLIGLHSQPELHIVGKMLRVVQVAVHTLFTPALPTSTSAKHP